MENYFALDKVKHTYYSSYTRGPDTPVESEDTIIENLYSSPIPDNEVPVFVDDTTVSDDVDPVSDNSINEDEVYEIEISTS